MNIHGMLRGVLFCAAIAALVVAVEPGLSGAQQGGTVIYACVAPSGTLRIVSQPGACRSTETLLQWNTAGPEGPAGPPGPQGPQGPAGPPGASAARYVTVFTGSEFAKINCGHAIRTVQFVKQSDDTRLRITYRDHALTFGEHAPAVVELKLNGASLTPTPLGIFVRAINSAAEQGFTQVGYADNVPAGEHTITTHYAFPGVNEPTACYRTGDYLIEIEEL